MAEATLTAITATYTCKKGHETEVAFHEDDTTERGVVSTYDECEECD